MGLAHGPPFANARLMTISLALALLSLFPAADTTDVSLAKEVERYLDQTTLAADGGGASVTLDGPTLKVKSADGTHSIQLNGRLMYDVFWMSSDDSVFTDGDAGEGVFDDRDGKFFRRLRLAAQGRVYENTVFKVQIDFSKSTIGIQDVYMGLLNLGFVKRLQIGHMNEPMGLDQLTSSKYISFVERAGASGFATGRNAGIRIDGGSRVTWSAGVFCTVDDQASVRTNGGGAFTFRVTGLVLEDEDRDGFVHVGFAFSYRGDDTYRLRMRPGPATGDRTVDTGTLTDVDSVAVAGFELAARLGPVHAMAEAFVVDIDTGGADPGFVAWYIEIGWFITGEVRTWKGNLWGRTKPLRNFHNAAGPGAWQVAFRYDSVDLVDDGVAGGEQQIITTGVNWHWNPHTRIMFNVMFAEVEGNDSDGDVTTFITRFQFDF